MFVHSFVMQYLLLFLACNHLAEEEIFGCFTIFMFFVVLCLFIENAQDDLSL